MPISQAFQPPPKRLTSKAQTALYRVAQEALTNIAKHASAENVWISLRPDSQNVVLRIEDDGNLRMDLLMKKSDDKSHGMGLRNMRERMDAFQGHLDIKSSRHGGLVVEARVPINPEWFKAQNDNSGPGKPRAA